MRDVNRANSADNFGSPRMLTQLFRAFVEQLWKDSQW
jgi:hypothetical protein